MAINVDDHGVADAVASQRQRLHTEARQERWMYELEHAMLQGGQKPAQERAGARAFTALDPAREPAPVAPGDTRHTATAADADVSTVAARAVAQPPRQTGTAAAETPHQANTDAVASAQQAATAVGHAGAPGLLPAAAVMAAPPAIAVSAMYAAAGATAVGGAAGAARSLAAVAATSDTDIAPLPKTSAGGTALLLARAPGLTPQAAAEEADAPPAAAQQQAREGEDYTAQLLHLYRDDAGVQAWIRDAAIGQQQALTLAQAMASTLGAAGAPLAALTVNGRRVPLSARLPGFTEATEAVADGSAAPAMPLAIDNINANGAL